MVNGEWWTGEEQAALPVNHRSGPRQAGLADAELFSDRPHKSVFDFVVTRNGSDSPRLRIHVDVVVDTVTLKLASVSDEFSDGHKAILPS